MRQKDRDWVEAKAADVATDRDLILSRSVQKEVDSLSSKIDGHEDRIRKLEGCLNAALEFLGVLVKFEPERFEWRGGKYTASKAPKK